MDLHALAECVKRADLDFDRALSDAMERNARTKDHQAAVDSLRVNAPAATEPPLAAPAKAAASSEHDALAMKYSGELAQVRALVDDREAIPDSLILDKLAANKGDVEKVILLFLDDGGSAAPDSRSAEAQPAAAAVLAPPGTRRDKGKEKMVYEDEFDDGDDAFMSSGAISVEAGGMSAAQPVLSDSEDSEEEQEEDAGTIDSDDAPEHSSEGEDSLAMVSCGSDDNDGSDNDDDEIDSWFEQPDVSRIRSQRVAKDAAASEVDLFTRALQEQADQEFAQQLQREFGHAGRPDDSSVYYSAVTNPFAKLAATPTSAGSWNYAEFQTKSCVWSFLSAPSHRLMFLRQCFGEAQRGMDKEGGGARADSTDRGKPCPFAVS